MDEDQMIENYTKQSQQSEKQPVDYIDIKQKQLYNIIYGDSCYGEEQGRCIRKLLQEIWQDGFNRGVEDEEIDDLRSSYGGGMP